MTSQVLSKLPAICRRNLLRSVAALGMLTLQPLTGFAADALVAPMTELFVGKPTHPMYVQHWHASSTAPSRKGKVIMVHGGSHTGTGWTTTPDGRPGWALRFANRGWDVYVVDWPGVGRSGTRPENLADTPTDIVDALALLLNQTGPAALVGHSIGAAVAFKLTERVPEAVLAVAALAPASVETVGSVVPPSPLDKLIGTTREGAQQRFANTARFPQAAFDNYFASLVPYGPRIRNAAIGLTGELKIDRSKTDIWNKRVPTLVLAGEEDRTVPPTRMIETTQALGVPLTMLGANWGMPGHGHLYIVEKETEAIADRVEDWLAKAVKR